MKLPQSVKIKDTVSLYLNKYQYKISLICPAANWFRGNDLDFVSAKLEDIKKGGYCPPWLKFKNSEDQKYCIDICKILKSFKDYDLRVEHPLLNFYTNDGSQIEKLVNIDSERTKYVCVPNEKYPALSKNSVIVKRLNYDYKVYIGRTRKSYPEFITWCDKSKNIRLTSRLKDDLTRNSSWGGSYFYVKGDNTLTMVKMFIGSEISKIEQIIKA